MRYYAYQAVVEYTLQLRSVASMLSSEVRSIRDSNMMQKYDTRLDHLAKLQFFIR